MKRQEVYKIIDQERDYQDKLIADNRRKDIKPVLTVGETISAIDYNLTEARGFWYHNSDPQKKSMEYIRKIAALCVQLAESYDMPERK